jgi:hypothetical protein
MLSAANALLSDLTSKIHSALLAGRYACAALSSVPLISTGGVSFGFS